MLSALVASTALPHSLKLNNGVMMPQVALGTWQYDNATAIDSIAKGLAAGFVHIDTAESYQNQVGVGQALAKVPRDSYFLTTKTLPCATLGVPGACYTQTKADFAGDLEKLGLDYVDLILLHGPSHRGTGKCDADACAADNEQWQLYEEMYAAGKAKAIGVSNYCASCLKCLNYTVTPAVNQFELHVGMGPDPQSLVSFNQGLGIVVQAYSPLGDGALVKDELLATIGTAHGKTGAQVALKWIVQQGLAVVTKADTDAFLEQDIDMYSWNLTAQEVSQLSASRKYPDNPSWACTE